MEDHLETRRACSDDSHAFDSSWKNDSKLEVIKRLVIVRREKIRQ